MIRKLTYVGMAAVMTACAGMLTGCTSGDGLNGSINGIKLSDQPIVLNAGVPGNVTEQPWGKSRAGDYSDYDDQSLDKFTLWIYSGTTRLYDLLDVKRTLGNGLQNCTVRNHLQIYWPVDKPLNLFAIQGDYPMESFRPVGDGTGVGVRIFNEQAKYDVMYAVTSNRTRLMDGGNVDLYFHHALSAVDLKLQNNTGFLKVTVHRAKIVNARWIATLTLLPTAPTGTGAHNDVIWTEVEDGRQEYDMGASNHVLAPGAGVTLIDGPGQNNSRYILPQTLNTVNHSGDNSATAYFELDVTVTDSRSGYDIVRQKTFKVAMTGSNGYQLMQDRRYVYTISFNDDVNTDKQFSIGAAVIDRPIYFGMMADDENNWTTEKWYWMPDDDILEQH